MIPETNFFQIRRGNNLDKNTGGKTHRLLLFKDGLFGLVVVLEVAPVRS